LAGKELVELEDGPNLYVTREGQGPPISYRCPCNSNDSLPAFRQKIPPVNIQQTTYTALRNALYMTTLITDDPNT